MRYDTEIASDTLGTTYILSGNSAGSIQLLHFEIFNSVSGVHLYSNSQPRFELTERIEGLYENKQIENKVCGCFMQFSTQQ